jgi:hypothetical protein
MGWHKITGVLSKALPLLCHQLPNFSKSLKFLSGLQNAKVLGRKSIIGVHKPLY